jgi:hypothetical protein
MGGSIQSSKVLSLTDVGPCRHFITPFNIIARLSQQVRFTAPLDEIVSVFGIWTNNGIHCTKSTNNDTIDGIGLVLVKNLCVETIKLFFLLLFCLLLHGNNSDEPPTVLHLKRVFSRVGKTFPIGQVLGKIFITSFRDAFLCAHV